MSRDEDRDAAENELPAGGAPALSLLQGVWGAKGQTSLDVDESCETGQCRASDQMGFDGLADEVEPTTDRNKAINNLQSAWRTTLEREGKLDSETKTIRDLVLNSDSDS